MSNNKNVEQQQRIIEEQNLLLHKKITKTEESLNSSVNDNMITNVLNMLKQPLVQLVAFISIQKLPYYFIFVGREN